MSSPLSPLPFSTNQSGDSQLSDHFQIIVKDEDLRDCGSRGDFLEIGGSSDLETADLETKEDICEWPNKKVCKSYQLEPLPTE